MDWQNIQIEANKDRIKTAVASVTDEALAVTDVSIPGFDSYYVLKVDTDHDSPAAQSSDIIDALWEKGWDAHMIGRDESCFAYHVYLR